MQTSSSSGGHNMASTRPQHNQTTIDNRRSAQYRDELDSSFYQLPGADDYMQSRPASVVEPHRTIAVAPPPQVAAIRPQQPQTNLSPPVSTISHLAPKPASAEFMLCLHQLCDVGFTVEHATIALKRCDNNVEEAISFCLEHDDEAMQQYITEEIVAHDARLHALLGTAAAGFATPSATSASASNNNTRPTGASSTEPTIKSKNVFKRMIGLKSKHAAGSGPGPSIAASPNSFNMPVVAVEPPSHAPQPTPAISFSTPSRVQVPSVADAAASLTSNTSSARSSAPPAMNPGYYGEVGEEGMDFSGLDGDGPRDEAVLNYSAMEEEVLLNSVLAESALEARQTQTGNSFGSTSSDNRNRSGSSITSAAGAAGGAALIRRMGSPRKSTTADSALNGGASTTSVTSSTTPIVVNQPPPKPLRPPSMQKMNSSSSSSVTPAPAASAAAPLITPVFLVPSTPLLSGAKYVEVTHEVDGSERWSVAVARVAEMSSLQEEGEEERSQSASSRRPISSVEDYGALMDIQGMLRMQQAAGSRDEAASLAVIDEIFAPTVAAPLQPVSVFVFPDVPSVSETAPFVSQTEEFFPSVPEVTESIAAPPPAVVAVTHDQSADELLEFGYVVPNIMSSSFYQNSLPAPLLPGRSSMLSAPSIHGLEISDSFEDLVSHDIAPLPLSSSVLIASSSSGSSSSDLFPVSANVEETTPISHVLIHSEKELPVVAEEEEQEEDQEEDLLRSDRGFAQSQYNLPTITSDEVRDDERYIEEDRVNLSHNSSSIYALDSIPEGNTRRSRQNLLAGIDEVLDRNHGLGTKLGGSVLVVPMSVPLSVVTSHSSSSSSSSAVVSSERDAVDSASHGGKMSVASAAFNKQIPPPGPKLTSAVTATHVTSAMANSSSSNNSFDTQPDIFASFPSASAVPAQMSVSIGDEREDYGFEAYTHAVTAESVVVSAASASGYEGDADTLTATAEVEEVRVAVQGSSDEENDEELQDAVRRVNEQIQRDELLEMTSMQTDSSHDSSTNLALAASLLDNNAFVASGSNSERSTYSAYAENNNTNSSSSSSQAISAARPTGAPSPQQNPIPTTLTPLYHEIQTHLRSVHKRKHLACTVNEHNGKFTAQISLKQIKLHKNENSPQGARSNSVIIGTCTTRELASDLCLTLAPPEWTGKQDSQNCILCNVGFTMFKKGHHCRNCGFIVCVACSNKAWPSSMLPTTYHDQEKYVRICSSCQTGTELFVRGLRQGDYQSVLSLYASGNVNLHCPISIYVNNAHPVHMAAAGGSLPLLQWLIETKKCSVKDNGTKKQLVTGKGLSVLAVAAQAGHVSIMRYLIHQRKCTVLEITEMSILHRALHVALESPGPMPPYVPPKGANRDDELLSEGGSVSVSQNNNYDNGMNNSSTAPRAPTSMAPNGVASSSAESGYAPHQLSNSTSSSSSTPPTGAIHSANTTPRTPLTAGTGSTVPRPTAARTTQLMAPLGPLNGPRAAQAQAAAAALAASTESIATPGIQLVAPLGPIHGRGTAPAINTNPGTAQASAALSPERRLPSYLTPSERQALVVGASAVPVAATATTNGPASPSVHTSARSIVAPRALYNEAPVNIATAEAVTGYAYTTPQTTPNGRGILQNLHNHNHAEQDTPVAATAFLTSDIIFEVSQHDANFTSQSADGHAMSVDERHVSVRHIAVASPYVATARGSELAAAPSPIQTGATTNFPELIVEGSAAPATGSGRTNGPRWW